MPKETANTNGIARKRAISRRLVRDRKSFLRIANSSVPMPGILNSEPCGRYDVGESFIDTGTGTQNLERNSAAVKNTPIVKRMDRLPNVRKVSVCPCEAPSTATDGHTSGINHATCTV
jgi:hypothetical protein